MKKQSLDELGRLSVEDYQRSPKRPVVLVLDSVRSLNNVGSAFRTADAFAIEKILLCGITGQPPHRDIQKTALGATESVVWEYFPKVTDALATLKAAGYMLVAVEQTTRSLPLEFVKFDLHAKYAFVVGNEVQGISEEALARCKFSIEIPQFGTKHSLNVSVSIGIVLWAYTHAYLVQQGKD